MSEGPIPSTLGPYRVLGVLGAGAMGVVYRAIDERLRREVAIKAIPPELARARELRERFTGEAQIQARLQHPHIVAVHHLLEVEGDAYLVMELFGSRSLESLLTERGGRGLPEPEALRLLSQVLSALNHAHSQGIIHRDVKPANVLVTPDGTAKLGDFGIALTLGQERRTRAAQLVGTPVYMSPEQIVRPQSLDHRSDIYSAAVLLFELLAGRPPFDGESEFEIQRQHLETPVEQVLRALPRTTLSVRMALERALAKDPGQRFSSAAAFERALHGAAPVPGQPTAYEKRREPVSPPAPAPRPGRSGRRSRWQTAILVGEITGLVLLGLLAMGRVLGWMGGPAPEPPRPEPKPPVSEQPATSPPSPPPRIVPRPARPPQVAKVVPPKLPSNPVAPQPNPDVEAAIRKQVLVELRRELHEGLAAAEQQLATGDLVAARARVAALEGRTAALRGELVNELAALKLLAERITEEDVAQKTAVERQRLEHQAWQRRLREIEALIVEQKYIEGKAAAVSLAADSAAPVEVATRARELAVQAEQLLPTLWQGVESETDATLVNPRRRRAIDLTGDDDDDDSEPRKREL